MSSIVLLNKGSVSPIDGQLIFFLVVNVEGRGWAGYDFFFLFLPFFFFLKENLLCMSMLILICYEQRVEGCFFYSDIVNG